jgi:hypothetical protein
MGGKICAAAAALLVFAAPAAAEPGSGPHETIDQTFTATTPGTPTGLGWSSTYHAAGDPSSPPPAMTKMVFYPPAGFRFDTSVPGQCTATDAELSLRGPAACPADSRLGEGTTEGLFLFPFAHDQVFDHFNHHLDVLNNAGEQVLLVESEGWTVQRGKFNPDGSLEFNATTCFPASPTGQCADDYIVQLGSKTTIPVYTNAKGSYATTPPTCPDTGYWDTTVRFWWADDTTDSVVTRQPCSVS